MKLTSLELTTIKVMKACICHPEYGSGYLDRDTKAALKRQGIESKTISGVFSSLVEKGIIKTELDEVEDDIVDGKYVTLTYYTFLGYREEGTDFDMASFNTWIKSVSAA
jgi:hypothetical protein